VAGCPDERVLVVGSSPEGLVLPPHRFNVADHRDEPSIL
jgi:hypothetical protein